MPMNSAMTEATAAPLKFHAGQPKMTKDRRGQKQHWLPLPPNLSNLLRLMPTSKAFRIW